MKMYTLYFTDESVPHFLGIDHNPEPGQSVLSAQALPSQIGVLTKALGLDRDVVVNYIAPRSPGAAATVRVRSHRKPVAQQCDGRILHFPDGSRILYRNDGTKEQLSPIDWEVW